MRATSRVVALVSLIVLSAGAAFAAPAFTYKEVMIPMRDGVKLQTVIMTPSDRKGPWPILFSRGPYGVPAKAFDPIPFQRAALARDGYIFVLQNVRGRFKSEGVFSVSTLVDASDKKAVNDATDAYDTIDWLVKNVPDNNGRVGITGISYGGLTAALTLLYPHPALKAVSEQAASADEWMNDDFHRYGALRLSYAVEYAVMEEADKQANSTFDFGYYDTYDWFLNLGPLSNVNGKYLHGKLKFWNEVVEHPDYDAYWKKDAWARQLNGAKVPLLNVVGFWDQEDPWGPWQIFHRADGGAANPNNFIVAGPWFHGGWGDLEKGDHIGLIPLGGHETAREFRENIEAPFFRYFLHGTGERQDWKLKSFQTGSNTWHQYPVWPPAKQKATKLYLRTDGTLSFSAPTGKASQAAFREYLSDPANPVPYRPRPIAPITREEEWQLWEVTDQRFVDHRPDVLSYVSAPLDHDLTISGPVAAALYASTSGTDSDFVVKLIDVYPEGLQKPKPGERPAPGDYARSLNGYQLPIAMEVRRGRYLQSFEHATPLKANHPIKWDVPLKDRDHVFLKGHRIMVQIQSSWFPVIDRNPQKFVPNIYLAQQSDYVKATQRVYSSPQLPSHILLPVVE